MYKEERDVLKDEMTEIDDCDMEEFGTLLIVSSETAIDILGYGWWPQAAKQEGDKISKTFLCNIWKPRNERPTVGGVSIRSINSNVCSVSKGMRGQPVSKGMRGQRSND